MVDWTNSERYSIENVDHQIHICGVKVPVVPAIVAAFAINIAIAPLLFFVAPVLLGLASRYFWAAEQRGRPIEYEPWFYNIFGRNGFVRELFHFLSEFKHAEKQYR